VSEKAAGKVHKKVTKKLTPIPGAPDKPNAMYAGREDNAVRDAVNSSSPPP
jgi:hypothetical protein